jgi:thioredoxin-dependent peroxiredoxin
MKNIVAGLAAGCAVAAGAVEIGKPAPAFEAETTAGRIRSADFAGRWLVLYFYPKSFTPGCTKQVCSVRDGFAELKAMNVAVFGVSSDSLDRQREFKKKYAAPFELIADAGGAVAKAFDNRGLAGLAKRRTFLIAPDGALAAVIEKPDVNDHAAQIAREIRRLQPQT